MVLILPLHVTLNWYCIGDSVMILFASMNTTTKTFREFWKTVRGRETRIAFAKRCGKSLSHMNGVASGARPCTESLAIAIERETGGLVPAEVSCPRADWTVIRGKAA